MRPTSDRVREAVFSTLGSLGAVAGATVADLFAGTGAMGIEALSRGAASVTFVDADSVAVATIRANLAATGLDGPAATVVRAGVEAWEVTAAPVDVAFLDPPYSFDRWAGVLEGLQAGLVVCESGADLDLGPRWEVLRARRYGGTVVTVGRAERGSQVGERPAEGDRGGGPG